MLPRVREVVASQPDNAALTKALAYLEARVAQMQYPQFVAEGWPIGSGMVESANKLVVEDRLKGAGMHWADANVNPLLALRNAVCNDRWDETWTVIEHEQRREVVLRRHGMRAQRSAPKRSEGVGKGGHALRHHGHERLRCLGGYGTIRHAFLRCSVGTTNLHCIRIGGGPFKVSDDSCLHPPRPSYLTSCVIATILNTAVTRTHGCTRRYTASAHA